MMAPPSAPPMMPPPQANMAPPPPAMPRQQFPASSNPYVANQPIATVPGLPAYSATNMMGVARQSPGQPMNPLNPESSEVFMQSPTTDTIRERQLQERTREHPEGTEKARYAPLSNDPSIDPLDHGYENWLKNIRGKQADQRDYDEEYEKFVRNISVMLFSLGQKQLSPETSAALKNIPADSLSAVGRSLEPKNPVDIARGKEMKDPFPKDDATVDAAAGKDIGKDVGLNIAVKPATVQVQRLLEMGYDALRSGQTEGAIAIYKNALASDPENKDALFGLATAYHRAGQLDQARDTYIQLINKDPNNWPAMNNFLVLAGEEAPEDALRQLKQLESINPEFGPLSAQIGMIYVQQGKIEDGIKYLSRAITLSPDNLAYRYNLAVVLDHGGYKQQAARLYAQILDFNGEKGQALPESREKIRDRLAFITSQKS
ncbi:MAG: tetratricopeptide repeat protein [Proteobacteria bacterium]|nr:tetratricopeptide repeat protein [Pseudomonadota bacterium]